MTTIIEISGGLGNQLFQLSLGLSRFGIPGVHFFLALPDTSKSKWDRPSLLQNILPYEAFIAGKNEPNRVSLRRILRKRSHTKSIRNESLDSGVKRDTGRLYDHSISFQKDCTYRGPFAHPAYWNQDPLVVLEQINNLIFRNSAIQKQIHQESRTCGIHIRRGDYKDNLKALNFHGLCGIEYYGNAISDAAKLSNFDEILIFCDDSLVARNFSSILNTLHPNVVIDNTTDPLDLVRRIALCDALIGCNSTLSWWGAHLGKDKLRIFPTNWFLNKEMSLDPMDLFFPKATKLVPNKLILEEDILS